MSPVGVSKVASGGLAVSQAPAGYGLPCLLAQGQAITVVPSGGLPIADVGGEIFVVPVTYTTWNTSDKSANILLSNGNLTAASSSSTDNGVRGVKAVSGGKLYFEVTYNSSITGVDTGCGIATSAAVLTTVGTNATNAALAYFSSAGAIWYNGSAVGGKSLGGGPVANDVVCIAVDMDNKRIWFRRNAGLWNNTAGDNPATNVGGIDISAVFTASSAYPLATINNATPLVTANFGASAFAQAVPSGFTSGWPS